VFALIAAFAVACANSSRVTHGEGASIAEARGEAADAKLRIAVGGIVDKSGDGKGSLKAGLAALNGDGASDPALFASGVRDVLTTALFQSGKFIVLERDAISDALIEQEFSAEGRASEQTRIPLGEIEGAQLLVVGAITGFDSGVTAGEGFPIPIPLNGRGDLAILKLKFRRGFIGMDLRVIDTVTGRVVSTVAVDGRATRFSTALTGFARAHSGDTTIPLPITLRAFANTPVEAAIQKMADAAVKHIADSAPQ
jgi:curli biogenesis system outer membrane secretion channel CsgG